jgi:sugar phosphate permease
VRYRVLAAVCLLALVAYVLRVGFAHAGTSLRKDLGLDQTQLADAMAVFLIAYGLFEIPWGLLGDRLGARHLLAVATLGWSALTAATVLLSATGSGWAFAALLLLRFAFGALQAGVFPLISRLLADWMPLRERGTAQGFVWTTSRAGGFLAPLLAASLVEWRGWGTALVGLSLFGLAWCALVWPWLRNTPEEAPGVSAAELELITSGRGPPALHGALPRLLRSRSVAFLCLMYAFGGFTATFFITLLPDYLDSQRGLGPEQVKWLSALPLGCGVVACLTGGWVSDWLILKTGDRKRGRRTGGVLGLSLAGFALLATIWVEDVWALGALLCAGFFFFDFTMGPAWAAAADIGERYAGTVGGAMNMVGNFGAAAGAKVAGELFGKDFFGVAGSDLVFVLFAVSLWLGALSWLGVDVTRGLKP